MRQLEETLLQRDRHISQLRAECEAQTDAAARYAAELERMRSELLVSKQPQMELERTVREVRKQLRTKDDEIAALRKAIMALKKDMEDVARLAEQRARARYDCGALRSGGGAVAHGSCSGKQSRSLTACAASCGAIWTSATRP